MGHHTGNATGPGSPSTSKGSGYIELWLQARGDGNTTRIAFAGRFTDGYMDWLVDLASNIASTLGLELEKQDLGFDA
jgi:hypothetical protein